MARGPHASTGDGRPTHTLRLNLDRTGLQLERCRLSVVSGPHSGAELVTERERIRIGASEADDLSLPKDAAVSRNQCEIRHTDKGYLLVDLGSTNGTFLEERRIERAYLAQGARFQVGRSTLYFFPFQEQLPLETPPPGEYERITAHSLAMRQVCGLARRVAAFEASVLVQGETGTGKELVARAIHRQSPRASRPFVVVDCGALVKELVESELFGHEKGAFTGATRAHTGAFERANGGTLYLDEVGELSLDVQPKLLRALENREVTRVGGEDVLSVDVRVVAATHRDLVKEVAARRFREDLFYRLAVVTLELPPLRDRREDLLAIAERLLADPQVSQGGPRRLSEGARELLERYRWPGNVRELRNALTRAAATSAGPSIEPESLPEALRGGARGIEVSVRGGMPFAAARREVMAQFSAQYVAELMRRCGGDLARAAKEGGLHKKSLERMMKRFGIES